MFNFNKILTTSCSRCFKLRRLFSQDHFRPVPLRPKKPKSRKPVSQYFMDNFIVETVGGKGGDGCISFLQLKSNENAGPDGGDGGNGGHVIFKASSNVKNFNSLKKTIKASDGERGFNKDCCGKNGKHEYVKVPLGTVIKNQKGVIIGDLNKEGIMFIAARGGAGGRGNHFFISDTLQTPLVAEFGAQGEKCKYHLEIKSMAHIGLVVVLPDIQPYHPISHVSSFNQNLLVGMPNAGKSTLLRAITRARPKVAAYSFTTLKPHIGIVQYSDYEQVAVADLPGLIEGSHENKGLGIEFLKHTERCKGILFLIDLSQDNSLWQYETLRHEISKFSEELNTRPFAIVGNKIDLIQAQENLKNLQLKIDFPIIGISAKTGQNLSTLLDYIRTIYDTDLKDVKDKSSI